MPPQQIQLLQQPKIFNYNNRYQANTVPPHNFVTPQTIINAPHNQPTVSSHISLYDTDKDNIVELVDQNITSAVYNSPYLWIVQFYAHWCGHCQRFAPIWKESAKVFRSKISQFFIQTRRTLYTYKLSTQILMR